MVYKKSEDLVMHDVPVFFINRIKLIIPVAEAQVMNGWSLSGVLQVKGVDDKNRVVTHSVDIIRSERDGVWLKGLPDEFRIITIGQGFVSQGDEVVAVDEEEKAAETL